MSFATRIASDVEVWLCNARPALAAVSPAIHQAGEVPDPFSERCSGWVEAKYDMQAVSHIRSEESHASRLNSRDEQRGLTNVGAVLE